MMMHSEPNMGAQIAKTLLEDGLLIAEITSDGSSQAHLGTQDKYNEEGIMDHKLDRHQDPYHLGSTQLREARSSNWSKDMFTQ